MKYGDFICERDLTTSYGIILSSGKVTYDVVWVGGSTSRYRHGRKGVEVVDGDVIDKWTRKHLVEEAAKARDERRRGARIKRGQVWPSR